MTLTIYSCRLSVSFFTIFVQCAAVDALKHFIPTYLVSSDEKIANDIISKYLALLDDPNVAARRGAALALGILPYKFLILKWMPIMNKLCSSCTIEVMELSIDISILKRGNNPLLLFFNTGTKTTCDLVCRISLMILMLKHV